MTGFNQLAPKALRLFDAERAHQLTILALKTGLGPKKSVQLPTILTTKLASLSLVGPVGLAAGFDKNAEVPNPMAKFGFSWVECGTVTPLPQKGNPKPRLFRLPKDQAVINRLGFNNQGLEAFADHLSRAQQAKPGCPIGANIGANKQSEDRIEDYCMGLRKLWGMPNWFTINISSPNTPGLRDLQEATMLDELLGRISETRAMLSNNQPSPPVFLKVAPDLDEKQIETISRAVFEFGLSGLIVSNTTIKRSDDLRSYHARQSGGLSGGPLFEPSTRILRLFRQASKGKIPLIGVGGISNGEQAWQKIKAGASAVQLYSALIYQGPKLVADIHQYLAEQIPKEGFACLADAVGADQPV